MKKLFKFLLSAFLITSLLISPLSAGGNRWTSKPPVGSQIDWSHPLSKGLVGCWLFNEGGGNIIQDIARRNSAIIQNPASGQWVTTLKGLAFLVSSGTLRYAEAKTSIYKVGQFTNSISWYIVYKAGATRGVSLAGNTDATSYDCLTYTSSANSRHDFYIRTVNGLTYTENNTGKIINSGTIYHYCGTYDGSIAKVYVDGKFEFSANQFSGNIIDNGYTTWFGRWGTSYSNDSLIIAYCFNRTLSPSEIQQLYQDPYCIINPPTIWSKFSTAVAAARRMWMSN